MSQDDLGAARPYTRFTADVAREICERVAAGESLKAICADPDMPSDRTVARWAREHPVFGAAYHRAKAFARPEGLGPTSTYCEATAHEICSRLAEGESLTAIADDPAMPAFFTILHWQRRSAEFAEAVALARQAQAERLADLGWEMALAATPETAYLTRVRLGQLRWAAAIKSPRTHGRQKAADLPAPPPPAAEPILLKHFVVETHPQTGQRRVITYLPDPGANRLARIAEGPWTELPAPAGPVEGEG